ncbi:MAG TPA: hypothetical protein VI199_14175 [Novosphingobium sp.]
MASSTSKLDKIRPIAWADEWNDELLDLIRVLSVTLDRQNALEHLQFASGRHLRASC